MSVVLNHNLMLGGLDDMLGGTLSSVHIGIYTNNPTLTPSSSIADLVEPTYTGYSRKNVTWETVFRQPDGSIAVQSQLAQFQMSDSNTPTNVNGYFVASGASGTPLLFSEPFPAGPVALADTLDTCMVSAQFVLGGSDYGDGTIIS